MTLNPFFMFATGSRTASRQSMVAVSGSTRWRNVAFTKIGAPTSTWCARSARAFCDMARLFIRPFRGPDRFDWSFSDETFARILELGIVPIVDLCHFGVPDWIGDFQCPDFPKLFVSYARAFAERFPWVQLYTPVNEMFICATFSGLYGWWNEQGTTDRTFVTALKHLFQANLLAMGAILEVRPSPDRILVSLNQSATSLGQTAAPLAIAGVGLGGREVVLIVIAGIALLIVLVGGRLTLVPGPTHETLS